MGFVRNVLIGALNTPANERHGKKDKAEHLAHVCYS